MKADEIRATRVMRKQFNEAIFLREIAAQLAEQNEQMREDMEMRRAIRKEQQAEQERIAAISGGALDAMRKLTEPPRMVDIVPVFRPANDESPQHLGCFVRLPDDTYGFAVNSDRGPGIVPIEIEEAKRILAILVPPSEAKPS